MPCHPYLRSAHQPSHSSGTRDVHVRRIKVSPNGRSHSKKRLRIGFLKSTVAGAKGPVGGPCQKESQAEYVRQFLSDFSNYCQHNLDYHFMIDDKTEIQTISNYLLEKSNNKNRLQIAAMIANNFKKIENQIITSFVEKLLCAMKEKFQHYKIEEKSKNPYPAHDYQQFPLNPN